MEPPAAEVKRLRELSRPPGHRGGPGSFL